MAKKQESKWYWNWFSKQAYMAIGAVALTLFVLFTLLKFITRHGQELEVPSFASLTMEQAIRLADENSLRLEVTDSVSIAKMAPGIVFKQNPLAGSKVKKNRRILLTINAKKPRMVEMPSLVGFSLRQAQTELISSGLKVGKLIYVEDIATNKVLAQYFKGRKVRSKTKVPSESEIDLELGINEDDNQTFVPDLLGLSYQLVKETLIDKSLNLTRAVFDNTVKTYADTLGAYVYKQSPSPSNNVPVNMGMGVIVYLSKDKPSQDKNEER